MPGQPPQHSVQLVLTHLPPCPSACWLARQRLPGPAHVGGPEKNGLTPPTHPPSLRDTSGSGRAVHQSRGCAGRSGAPVGGGSGGKSFHSQPGLKGEGAVTVDTEGDQAPRVAGGLEGLAQLGSGGGTGSSRQ